MQAHPHAWAAPAGGAVAGAGGTPGTSSYHQPTTLEEVRTLWIGDLQYWVDESYLHGCFAHTGEVVSVKIIRNKITGLPEGYGFIEFVSHEAAERILQTYNGLQMPGTEHTFRLNWASFGMGERRGDPAADHSIFVGDLAPDVTDYMLQETFRTHYSSVRGAKVVTDPNTGRSKGYGFVKFADEAEKNRAMTEMNGVYCSTRPMRISAATPKKTTGVQIQASAEEAVQRLHGTMIGQQIVRLSWGRSPANKQDASAAWGQQADPSQWAAYYGYGYDAYAYGVEGAPEMTSIVGSFPSVEQKEETYDPLAIPDVDKLNRAYLAVHGNTMLGRPLWLKTSSLSQSA
ncbi:Polyadenylate-binding protein RBP47B' [Ananas comosus]|uniref:Polyadenylate-binding protein RBP47B n=1 Tax=Ananas comosus TaxID=4615 RepID=A0A199VS41_ANACO|nr:Polyadenylate-binding protein RBP47B' [Ananas comosus]